MTIFAILAELSVITGNYKVYVRFGDVGEAIIKLLVICGKFFLDINLSNDMSTCGFNQIQNEE